MTKEKILLDLDGTLKTDYNDFVETSPEAYVIESDAVVYRFLKRPYADTFLKKLKEKYEICLATFSRKDYAIKVLNAMGIRAYFDRVITYENFNSGRINSLSNFTLVDNSEHMGNEKVRVINDDINSISILKELIIVDTYTGDKDDKVLLDLADIFLKD